ncbi:MAG: hypothetical protein Q9M37_03490 [Desulfonauticus sp.]|nr:hypothetical protein [Desulfonauticus sp.]
MVEIEGNVIEELYTKAFRDVYSLRIECKDGRASITINEKNGRKETIDTVKKVRVIITEPHNAEIVNPEEFFRLLIDFLVICEKDDHFLVIF